MIDPNLPVEEANNVESCRLFRSVIIYTVVPSLSRGACHWERSVKAIGNIEVGGVAGKIARSTWLDLIAGNEK